MSSEANSEADLHRLAARVASACRGFSEEQIHDALLVVLSALGVTDLSSLAPRLSMRLRQISSNPEQMNAPKELVERIALRLASTSNRANAVASLLGTHLPQHLEAKGPGNLLALRADTNKAESV